MIKFWIYLIILVLIAVVGLAIGAANDSRIAFDFLIAKSEVSVAFVLVVGIIFGLLLGLYMSALICIRFWCQTRAAKAALSRYKKDELQRAKAQEQPADSD